MNMRIILRLGYTPNKVFKHYSCEKRMYSDPWKSREYGYLMIVSVDGDAEENQNPKQSLEVEENIRTHFVDLDENICENLQKLAEENKYDINSKVWTFALGISFRKIID